MFDAHTLRCLQEYRDRTKKLKLQGDTRGMEVLTHDLIGIALDFDEGYESTIVNAAVKRFMEKIVSPYFLHPDPDKADLPIEELATKMRMELARIPREDWTLLHQARDAGTDKADPIVPLPIGSIKPEMPKPILNVSGLSGSVLAEGSVSILTGEGGVAKSIFALEIATLLSHYGGQEAGLLQGLLASSNPSHPGNVLYLTYEDANGVISKRYRDIMLRNYASPLAQAQKYQLYVMEMAGHPLFGPPETGLSQTRPQCLPGWDMVQRGLAIAEDWRLLIIDPALSAFVGNANDAPQVREFITQLGLLARHHQMGILVIAHTNKEARRVTGQASDIFRAGQTGGSTHWTDAARGALSFHLGLTDDERQLIVTKANWGPSHLGCRVTITNHKDRFGGFKAHSSGWQNETDYQAEMTALSKQAKDAPDGAKRKQII